jgi:YNFM family putative membrane transporter
MVAALPRRRADHAVRLCADYSQLLVLRALLGVALGGMPAVAMAYLGEEIEPASLGLSMGMYIGGSAFGGMAGRVLASVLSDFLVAPGAGAMGAAGLYAAWEFWRSLPGVAHFRRGQGGWRRWCTGTRSTCATPACPGCSRWDSC